jgi:hypothetical protein
VTEKYVLSKIRALDREIDPLIAKLSRQAQNLVFHRVCRLDNEKEIAKQQYPGVYLIEIHVDRKRFKSVAAWLDEFKEDWDGDEPKKHFTPGTKAKRIKEHPRLLTWMPLYLGIRKTTIAERISQHMSLEASANTGGLKLNCRGSIRLRNLRLSTIELELKAYNAMMPAIEVALRNRLNPILGR